MSENIEFVLSAQDNASAIFKRTAAELDMLHHRMKESGLTSKVLSETFRDLGQSLDVEWMTAAGDRISMISDKFNNLQSIMAKGSGASLAMKAGIVGLTAVGAFEFGKMIGDWIWQTERFSKEFDKQMSRAKDLMSQATDLRQKQIERERKEIDEFITGSDQKLAKSAELKTRLDAEIKEKQKQLEVQKRLFDEQEKEWFQSVRGTEFRKKETQTNIEGIQQTIDMLKQQKDQIQRTDEQIVDNDKRKEEARLQMVESMEKELDFRNRTFKLSKEEVEILKIQENINLTEAEKQRQLAILESLHAKEAEKRADEERLALAKKLAKEEEGRLKTILDQSKARVKEAEKQLKEAEAMSLEVERTSLQATSARGLTQQISGPSAAERAAKAAERNAAIAEAQKNLEAEQLRVAQDTYKLLLQQRAVEGLDLG